MGEKVFISYSRTDGAFVLELARDLRAAGVDLWVDQLDIRTGETWDNAVEDALQLCTGLLVVLSPDAVASRSVMDEVSYALEENKRVIPVIHRPCKLPFRLRRVQYSDLTTDYERGLSELIRVLGGTPPAPEAKPAEVAEVPPARMDTAAAAPVPGLIPQPLGATPPAAGDERPRIAEEPSAPMEASVRPIRDLVPQPLGATAAIAEDVHPAVAENPAAAVEVSAAPTAVEEEHPQVTNESSTGSRAPGGLVPGLVVQPLVVTEPAAGEGHPEAAGQVSRPNEPTHDIVPPIYGKPSWSSRHPRLDTALKVGGGGALLAVIFAGGNTATVLIVAALYAGLLFAAAGAIAGPRRGPLLWMAAMSIVAWALAPQLLGMGTPSDLGFVILAPQGAVWGAVAGIIALRISRGAAERKRRGAQPT